MEKDVGSHTPGPWTTESAPHRAWVASVGHNSDDPQIWTERQAKSGESYEWGDKKADARLIAAAPDLLEALEWAMTKLARPDARSTHASGPYPYLEKYDAARAAIAKAKGP